MPEETKGPVDSAMQRRRVAVIVIPSVVDALDRKAGTAAAFVASSLAAVTPGAQVAHLEHQESDLVPQASVLSDHHLDIYEFKYGEALNTAFDAELPPIRVWTYVHLMATARMPTGFSGVIYAIWTITPLFVLGAAIWMFIDQLLSGNDGQAFTLAVFSAVLSLLAKPAWSQLHDSHRVLTPMAMFYRRQVRRGYIKKSLSSAVHRLCDHGYERVLFAGHSFGAMLALEVATDLGEDVHQIVTVGAPARQFQRAGLISAHEQEDWATSAALRGGSGTVAWLNISHELDPMSSTINMAGVEDITLRCDQKIARISAASAHSGYWTDCERTMPAVARFFAQS